MGTVANITLPSIAQQSISSQNTETGNETSSSAEIGKTEFLNLLITQLKHQDPMNPVNNQEFVAQMATFSQLEQLIAINQAVTKMAAADADEDEEVPSADQ
jgi:flagellar basal-body rod modification protein FlgD